MSDLCSAIAQRRLVAFTYDGFPRVVIPAAHGPHASTSNHVLRGYQVEGGSASRHAPFWSLFTVSKMVGLEVLDQNFDSEPVGYVPNDSDITVHCQLRV